MPNPIKYSTGSETNALKKGNFYIGTGDVGKGPSDTTGFYQGVSPSSGGYVIYMNKSGAPGDLSYHNAANDSELISFTNNLAGQSYTTVQECLVYYASQTDKVVLNRDYEGIVTDGLVLNLDAGFTPSYPKNGTTWYNTTGSGNNFTLYNGATYNNDGYIEFDGTDDWGSTTNNGLGTGKLPHTLEMWVNFNTMTSPRWWLANIGQEGTGAHHWIGTDVTQFGVWNGTCQRVFLLNGVGNWQHIVGTFDGTNLTYYVNSINRGGFCTTNEFNFNNTNFTISKIPYNPQSYFNGKVSITRIYNRALNDSEILQNFNAQKGRFGL